MASRGPGRHREERSSAYLDREHHRILHYTLQCPGFGATSRVWQRMQASVELALDHRAEERLPNSEYSLSPRPILVFGCAARMARAPVSPKTRQAIRGVSWVHE